MKTYQEGVLAALTDGENFDAVWEIYDLYPEREDFVFHIAAGFVRDLEKGVLAAKCGQTLLATIVSSNDDVGVYLYSPQWNDGDLICFGVEFSKKDGRWYSGIWFDKKKLRDAADDLKVKAARLLPDSDGYKTDDGDDWLRYKVLGEFDGRDDVCRLLPPNRGSTVEEYAAELWDIATKCSATVDKWLDGVKKK